MPIYEYKCKKCNRTYELLQGITEPEADSCIHCGGPAGKLISLSSFHLKGSGWYTTDYGGKKTSCEAKKDSCEAKKEGNDTSACSEKSCAAGGCDA